MKRTDNLQINTKLYWDNMYLTEAGETDYWAATNRFPSIIDEIKDGDKTLDIGCGVCYLGKMIHSKRKNCEIWGVDISSTIIDKSKKRFPYMHLYQGYVGYCTFLPDNYFDVVSAGEIIEHLDDPSILFREAYRVLKKGGILIVTTPREAEIFSSEHVWEFTEGDIIQLFTENGFSFVTFKDLPDMESLKVIVAKGIK